MIVDDVVALLTVALILYVLSMPTHGRKAPNPPPGDPEYKGRPQVRPDPPPSPPSKRFQ